MSCAALIGLAAWEAELARADLAHADLDVEGFRTSVDIAASDLGCLGEPISPAAAAHFHRLQGIRADAVRDPLTARRAFLAARRLEPAYRFPLELFPEDHPIRRIYGEAMVDVDVGVRTRLPRPPRGELWVDGAPAGEVNGDAPAIVQWVDRGRARWSGYLRPGEGVGYPTRAGARWALVAGAGAAGAVGVAAALLSADAHGRYEDEATPASELDLLRDESNRWGAVAVGGSVLALGCAVGAGLTWVF